MLVVRSALRFREIVRRSLAEARELVSLPVDVTVQFLLTVLRGFWGARHREKRGAARAPRGLPCARRSAGLARAPWKRPRAASGTELRGLLIFGSTDASGVYLVGGMERVLCLPNENPVAPVPLAGEPALSLSQLR